VIEGDEYDCAFFDKRSKFIHYAPHIAVLNNLEFDHADIFRDLADVQRTFSHLVRIVPRNGFVVLNGDDSNLRALGAIPWTRVVRVGLDEGQRRAPRRLRGVTVRSEFSSDLARCDLGGGEVVAARNLQRPQRRDGRDRRRPRPRPRRSDGLKLDALARFRGVKRRQEILWNDARTTVIEDFGHHPTALAETLQSLRARFPGHAAHRRLRAPQQHRATKVDACSQFAGHHPGQGRRGNGAAASRGILHQRLL
jgi:UDP-N-acetylmuramate: L-alanyl-gamma-D-glutamyl-meso-diaminopimelate ligase